ncbi:class I SAM-dependent RNA methyltransferase [Maritimibacter sp. DP1N21-5]|uniref:class I SAM-dependent RNA methyltransferase n=1 Tax=Maritimibacter sp. DP1N21-5 TaxID=2836867 RepID=UPI001C45ADF0|nr:RsmD family RNA methyltransferase [Maritimibacter sp. DP1N21-5]MBV7410992.1 RsmD family RNA methyltransferase [Maritimibacter sp. DP1N21-5]
MTELTIERLGHQGDGIAKGPVFVPRTLPGEVIAGEVVDGRIETPVIVTPSADRVKPPCPHYRMCGGCSLQHASDAFVENWKVQVVETALVAQGISTTVRGIMTSPANARRRAVLSGRRTKKGALVGFHAPRSDVLTPVPDCRLLAPGIMAGLPGFEALVIAGGSRKGEVRITVSESEAGLDVWVSGGKPLDLALETELARIAGEQGFARLAWGDEVIATALPPVQRFGRAGVVVPPGSFLQATKAGEAALLAAVQEAVGDASRVIDLFAGSGTFSLPLAERAEVHGVEGEREMLRALEQGWRQSQGLKQVTVETRDLFRRPLLADELAADAIVIDPPRAGAEAQVVEVAKSPARRIAAVSCNPVTFARDAKILTDAGYKLDWIVVVDQFRWSSHVELAAQFSR